MTVIVGARAFLHFQKKKKQRRVEINLKNLKLLVVKQVCTTSNCLLVGKIQDENKIVLDKKKRIFASVPLKQNKRIRVFLLLRCRWPSV